MISKILASIFCVLSLLSCSFSTVSGYTCLSGSSVPDHLSVEQRTVLETRKVPSVVCKGPLRTSLWVYCIENRQRYWVEFDANGNILHDGVERDDIPCSCDKILK